MKKTPPPKALKKSSKASRPLPETLTPAVAQAVLEDAVMEAAADLAALSLTLDGVSPAAPTLDGAGVPYLGETRARALADAGIRTLSDLEAASAIQIGSIKGVGLRNGEKIKEWLAARGATPAPADSPTPPMPPPPPNIDAPAPVLGSPDPALATDNQAIFDDLGEVDLALARLAEKSGLTPRLLRQFDKLSSVTSELAEAPDTMSPKQLQRAVKRLADIVVLLQEAADAKSLPEKKQERLTEALREQRRDLQKLIGG